MAKPEVQTDERPDVYIGAKIKAHLVDWLDTVGAQQNRSRSNMIETIIEEQYIRSLDSGNGDT